MEDAGCCIVSGNILGKNLAQEIPAVRNLGEFIHTFEKKASGYFPLIEYTVEENQANLKIYRSVFWEVIDRSSIDKIKNAGCISEGRFIKHTLLGHFSRVKIDRVKCHREGSKYCEFSIWVE